MFTVNERDLHRMPTPARTHLPVKQFIIDSEILDDERDNNNEADIALLRLPAPSLRGTFAKAYTLLAKLVSLIGWDELLKCRSVVFVMEEVRQLCSQCRAALMSRAQEYRLNKQHGESSPTTPLTTVNGHPLPANGDAAEAERDAVVESKATHPNGDAPPADDASTRGMVPPGSPIPTIKISTESDGERERLSHAGVLPPSIAKPEPSSEGPTAAPSGAEADTVEKHAQPPASLVFSNKRLCERWLDNLFMVLYEVRWSGSAPRRTRSPRRAGSERWAWRADPDMARS
jgi:hypothetical protein